MKTINERYKLYKPVGMVHIWSKDPQQKLLMFQKAHRIIEQYQSHHSRAFTLWSYPNYRIEIDEPDRQLLRILDKFRSKYYLDEVLEIQVFYEERYRYTGPISLRDRISNFLWNRWGLSI